MSNNEALEPCPFNTEKCGNPELIPFTPNCWHAVCSCGASGPLESSPAKAQASWNNRVKEMTENFKNREAYNYCPYCGQRLLPPENN